MENSLLVAVSRQDVLRRQMSVIANNLANMNTTAFKAEKMLFVDHLVRTPAADDSLGEGIVFVRDIATVRDSADGRIEHTGGDLDVALVGDGWLTVETALGQRFTRNGHLRLDTEGRLVTESGLPVLGEGDQPIQFTPQDSQIVVAGDGTVSTDSGRLGRLKVVRFAEPEKMQAIAGGLLSTEETPTEVATPTIVQGALEASNVEPILEMERLIQVHRAYDQAKTVVDREDDRIRKMMQVYSA